MDGKLTFEFVVCRASVNSQPKSLQQPCRATCLVVYGRSPYSDLPYQIMQVSEVQRLRTCCMRLVLYVSKIVLMRMRPIPLCFFLQFDVRAARAIRSQPDRAEN